MLSFFVLSGYDDVIDVFENFYALPKKKALWKKFILSPHKLEGEPIKQEFWIILFIIKIMGCSCYCQG